ncbi:hypothetical protein H310_04345 [Aphanomyces invadans]|uniref:C2H2-type domain-containing protein n=1 Tax=Aphanomyces invadans TaxID=157072 RepID=A0A024UDI9_9STRA|nr:hypothetical protein H310_04345 [Aphanomyces invadans]ETW03927.1 hypothetical protein H310_04345 [Aphanomyces invadans]|eukprot:XP_008866883.1 hypothetical protein H310_04345 [Aphanomyces invadans]
MAQGDDDAVVASAVLRAVHATLGSAYVDYYTSQSKNRLRRGKRPASSGDLELPFAIDVFKAHITSLHQRGAACKDAPLSVTTVSTYGLTRVRTYASSTSLGHEMATFLMEDDELRAVVADIRVCGNGVLTFTSHRHLEWHATHGRLPCSMCGKFFKGPKGIRVHQMLHHDSSFASAQGEALATDLQIVVYTAPLVVPSRDSASSTSPSPTSHPPVPSVPAPIARISNPGILAAQGGHLSTLKQLVEQRGWNPLSEDHNGCNALVWAAGAGHVDICEYLVTTCGLDARALQGKRDMRRSPLHWAARNGHINMCAFLVVDLGVDVDSPTDDGTTAFHYAVWNAQLATCVWLVTTGQCNVHSINSYGCNASQWACLTGRIDVLAFLHRQRVDFKLVNHNGHSALHKAAMKGHMDACRWLVAVAGLDHRHMLEDDDGFTPSRFAIENGYPELGAYLAMAAIDANHDLEARDNSTLLWSVEQATPHCHCTCPSLRTYNARVICTKACGASTCSRSRHGDSSHVDVRNESCDC